MREWVKNYISFVWRRFRSHLTAFILLLVPNPVPKAVRREIDPEFHLCGANSYCVAGCRPVRWMTSFSIFLTPNLKSILSFRGPVSSLSCPFLGLNRISVISARTRRPEPFDCWDPSEFCCGAKGGTDPKLSTAPWTRSKAPVRHLVAMMLKNMPLWLYFRSFRSSEKSVKL